MGAGGLAASWSPGGAHSALLPVRPGRAVAAAGTPRPAAQSPRRHVRREAGRPRSVVHTGEGTAALALGDGLVVERRTRLLAAAALGKATGVDRSEPDLLDQSGHERFGLGVIAREEDREAVVSTARLGAIAQDLPVHRVEALDHLGPGRVPGEHFARGRTVVIELSNVPVAVGVVVGRVDDNSAGEGFGRQLGVGTEWDRHEDDVSERCGLLDRGGDGVLTYVADQIPERLGSAGVRDGDLVPGVGKQTGRRRADLSAADDADSHPQAASCASVAGSGRGPPPWSPSWRRESSWM